MSYVWYIRGADALEDVAWLSGSTGNLVIVDRNSDGTSPYFEQASPDSRFYFTDMCSKGTSRAPSYMWKDRFQARSTLGSQGNLKFGDFLAINRFGRRYVVQAWHDPPTISLNKIKKHNTHLTCDKARTKQKKEDKHNHKSKPKKKSETKRGGRREYI